MACEIDRSLVEVLYFSSSRNDLCLYIRHTDDRILMVGLYVDDILISGSNFSDISSMTRDPSHHFYMKYIKEATVCLRLEIKRDRHNRILHIGQSSYIAVMLEPFRMSDAKPESTPMDTALQQVRWDDDEETGRYARH